MTKEQWVYRGAKTRASDAILTQTGRVVQSLAIEMASIPLDAQMPTVTELSHRFGVGTGTVQRALQVLQWEDAIVLEPRGRLGTFLRQRDVPLLYELSGHRLIVCGMPLPYSRRYEGLATGIKESWTADGLPLIVGFVRGALQRLDALASHHHDFTVASRYTANMARTHGYDVTIAADFGPQSYLLGHAIFFGPGAGPEIQNGYRVGIDRSSVDQVTLTELATSGLEVELMDVGYMQLIEYLQTKRINAAVWSAGELYIPTDDVTRQPLGDLVSDSTVVELTTAVILTRSDDVVTRRLLDDALKYDHVVRIQSEVLAGDRLPSY